MPHHPLIDAPWYRPHSRAIVLVLTRAAEISGCHSSCSKTEREAALLSANLSAGLAAARQLQTYNRQCFPAAQYKIGNTFI